MLVDRVSDADDREKPRDGLRESALTCMDGVLYPYILPYDLFFRQRNFFPA